MIIVVYSYVICTLLIFADLKDVFELFDFWDGRDGAVDAFKLGDVCRCLGINPRNEDVFAVGGTQKMGTSSLYVFDIMHSSIIQLCSFGGTCYYLSWMCGIGRFVSVPRM